MPITLVVVDPVTEHARMRLLLVAPEGADRDLVVSTLAQAGYGDVLSTEDLTSTHRLCVTERPDAVLLDLGVAESSELALAELRSLTGEPERLPVLGLIAGGELDARRRAIALGIRDFVAKPIDVTELLLRVRNVLRTRRLEHQPGERTAILSQAIGEHTTEPDTARESLSILAAVADYHDDDTSQHAERVGIGAALIARTLALPESFVKMLRDAAPLHDIGKVGISRRILLKPGKLSPAEWMHMMRHVEMGAQILAPARSPVLRLAAEIARTHHERWDGKGYVAGLVGEEIPLSGRITALADVWDTLTHERPYKPAWSEERALAEIARESGAHFDPRVVEAFDRIDRHAINELAAEHGAERAA